MAANEPGGGRPSGPATPLASPLDANPGRFPGRYAGSVIIPAHNEAKVIGRLLRRITSEGEGELEIVVVCNGCVDATAAVARTFSQVQVVELEKASKHAALLEGERRVTRFPRAYLDADVEIDAADLRRLMEAVERSGVLAVGPRRHIELSGSSWTVRSFYAVWACLPAMQGLQGRGVIVVSKAGHERLSGWPELMADDLFVSSRFLPTERRVIDETSVTIHGPRTTRDLVRRRIRAARGNVELVAWDPALSSTAGESLSYILTLFVRRPTMWPHLLAFLAITSAARASAAFRRRSLTGVWLRDESSRS